MEIVTFPYVAETFKRALHEILAGYFGNGSGTSGGGTRDVAGQSLDLYRVKLGYEVHQVNEESDRPRITLTGSRGIQLDLNKCIDDNNNLIDRIRYDLLRTVYVSVPKTGNFAKPPYTTIEVEPSSYRMVDRVWGQLLAVVNAEGVAWYTRQIRTLTLEPTPTELVDNDYWIGRGLLRACVEVSRPRT